MTDNKRDAKNPPPSPRAPSRERSVQLGEQRKGSQVFPTVNVAPEQKPPSLAPPPAPTTATDTSSSSDS